MPCASRCSFKQTENINTLNGPGRRGFGCTFGKMKTEEKPKIFLVFSQNSLFFRFEGDENLENFSEKTEVMNKIFFVPERADQGLSSHVFISISTIMTKLTV